MPKDQTVIIRVDADTKRRIEAAARRQGLSITTFLLRAADEAARKVEAMQTTEDRTTSEGCPTFFRARCLEATRGGA